MAVDFPFGNRLWVFGIAVIAQAVLFAQADSGVAISYKLMQDSVTVEEPVILDFSIENGLTEDVIPPQRVNYSGYGGFRGSVIRPDGRKVEFPKPSADEVVLGRPRSIAAHQSLTTQLLLNKWVDFNMAGRYIVQIETAQPL